MKVLLVNKFHFYKGGAETYYFTLAELLKRAGHQVIFFSMKHEKNIKCDQEEYFVENREYVGKSSFIQKMKAFKNFVYSKETYNNLSKLIEEEKPDLAILNNIHRQLTTAVVDALYDHKIKMYWVVHDLIMLCPNYQMLDGNGHICEDCCSGKYKNCIKKKCVKNSKIKSYLAVKEAKYNKKNDTYKKIDMFITPSNFYRNKLIQYGFDEKKIEYIPNPLGVNFSFQLNKTNDNYLLYFGRLSREKGVDDLINSVLELDFNLIIVGTGPCEDYLKRISQKNDKIKFVGFKQGNELNDYVKKAKCVVLPSKWYENGPYSAMEAMGFGKPLIVSKYGGLPELVNDGENGYIYNETNELKQCIVKMMNNPNYELMCEKSFEKAKALFDFNTYIKKLKL